jgi:hypothetical protein
VNSKIELTVDDPKGKIVWNWNFIWGYNEYKELIEALESNEDKNEK